MKEIGERILKGLEYSRIKLDNCIKNRDTERAHVEADEVLKMLITDLSTAFKDDIKQQVKEVLSKYEDVEKWYA